MVNEQNKKGIDQALKVYESELTRKVYASSKRLDMEYDIYRKLSGCCSDIFQLMQQLYPNSPSTLQIQYDKATTVNELATAIRNFEREIGFSIAFIPNETLVLYKALLNDAETFFSDAWRHGACWDDTKDDRARKDGLRNIAYEAKMNFHSKSEKVGILVRDELLKKDRVS